MTDDYHWRIFGGMEYIVRPAEEDDIPALYGVSLNAHSASYYGQLIPNASKIDFQEHYSWSQTAEEKFTAEMLGRFTQSNWRIAVAVTNEGVRGYTLAQQTSDDVLLLRGLFVDPDYHGGGMGTALLRTSLTWARKGQIIRLAVIERNAVARRMYEKLGFVITETKHKDFYGAKMIEMERVSN